MDKIMEGLKSVNHAKTYEDIGGLYGYMDTIRQNLNIIEEIAGNSYSRFDKAVKEDSESFLEQLFPF